MKNFRVKCINHLGIAAKDSDKATWFFTRILGLANLGAETVTDQKTHTIMIESEEKRESEPAMENSPRLEILVPVDGQGPIAKFLETRGSGIHHVALTVDNVEHAIAYLLANSIEMIDQTPRPGAHNTRIAFVHPRSTGGILVELVEEMH